MKIGIEYTSGKICLVFSHSSFQKNHWTERFIITASTARKLGEALVAISSLPVMRSNSRRPPKPINIEQNGQLIYSKTGRVSWPPNR